MAAQRCAAGGDRRFNVAAIDIEGDAAAQAGDNFAASPWAAQLSARHISLADFVSEGHDGEFDVIVSNPPYYITGKSIVPSGEQRDTARRDSELTLDDVLGAASLLLAPRGRLSLILPVARGINLQEAMERYGMAFTRKCLVRTTERKEPSRMLVEISRKSAGAPSEDNLTIGSEAFRKLTGDYYL
jgi:tRNA1Val (adenine37-N6)-methyltransferase